MHHLLVIFFAVSERDISFGFFQTSQEETEEDSELANTKEKTPMCLINELARFNKVKAYVAHGSVSVWIISSGKGYWIKSTLAEGNYQGSSVHT